MKTMQPGVLAPVPVAARYLTFSLATAAKPARVRMALAMLAELADGDHCVVGIGDSVLQLLGKHIPGMRPFPSFSGKGMEVPATPAGLWCWLRGKERGDLLHRGRAIEAALDPVFELEEAIDAFRHGSGRDVTGYEDGTENPRGAKAVSAAAMQGMGAGLDGSTIAAVQLWVHDFASFDAMSTAQQDNCIGRRRSDNVELARAPASAHVKRTAQESFEPEAFVLRRSMAYTDGPDAGLMFVAFGRTPDAYEAQLRRMVGAEDGIVDGLFRFTRPVTGAYFWCPPVSRGRIDMAQVI